MAQITIEPGTGYAVSSATDSVTIENGDDAVTIRDDSSGTKLAHLRRELVAQISDEDWDGLASRVLGAADRIEVRPGPRPDVLELHANEKFVVYLTPEEAAPFSALFEAITVLAEVAP